MTMTIEVQCEGRVKLIDIIHPICRIGSNPSLELCIQGIESHTATLRMQNGKRIIYNRSPKPLRVGKKSALPDQTVEWLDGEELQLSDLVRMRLAGNKQTGSKQTKAPESSKVSTDSSSPARTSADSSSASNKKQRNQLLIAFFLVFGVIVFNSGSNQTNDAMNHDLGELVSNLQSAEDETGGGIYREIRFQVQTAALRANRRESSLLELSALLPQIAGRPELQSQVNAFVTNHLR